MAVHWIDRSGSEEDCLFVFLSGFLHDELAAMNKIFKSDELYQFYSSKNK